MRRTRNEISGISRTKATLFSLIVLIVIIVFSYNQVIAVILAFNLVLTNESKKTEGINVR